MGAILAVIFLVLLVIGLIIAGPHIFIWSVNSLAEIGGADFYIDHSLWSWWVAFVFLLMITGSRTSYRK